MDTSKLVYVRKFQSKTWHLVFDIYRQPNKNYDLLSTCCGLMLMEYKTQHGRLFYRFVYPEDIVDMKHEGICLNCIRSTVYQGRVENVERQAKCWGK